MNYPRCNNWMPPGTCTPDPIKPTRCYVHSGEFDVERGAVINEWCARWDWLLEPLYTTENTADLDRAFADLFKRFELPGVPVGGWELCPNHGDAFLTTCPLCASAMTLNVNKVKQPAGSDQ